ncbi:TetR/AcrR family transcriptional regulator [Brachybacterium sp. YJGR34]|uniref:TetR/AcrR family transcriptional regulator n=1 Tax=Brachybacterium sp. YJGR34 TaxID=2059911 RepID=UPI000E0BA9D8|nr:TetR family transcriptional regulator [Brachybacterium sp. YJGR34]
MTSTRDALLAAAAELLDTDGPEAVTMRAVGAGAGVSHNTPYKHFADKQVMLAEIAACELRETARILRAHRDDPAAALRAAIERSIDRPHRFRLVYGRWTVESSALAAAAADALAALVDLVDAAVAAGRIATTHPALTADLIRSTVHGAIELHLGGHLGKGQAPVTVEQIVDELLARLSPRR